MESTMAMSARRDAMRWVLLLLLLLAGCASDPPRQTEFMSSIDGVDMSSRELKLRLYAFATDFAGTVEHTADVIHAASDDPLVRQNALLWKINAVPALHSQVFVEDPLVGSISAYALCRSMGQYFSPEGAGATVFGPWQDLASVATDTLQQQIYDLILLVKPDEEFEQFRQMINVHVAENPLRDLTFTRQSTMGYMAPLMSAVGPGGLSATGAMNEQMRVLNDRMAIYAEFVPKHIRWQTELMVDQFPELAAEQREAIINDARVEALAAWEVIARMLEEQRTATMYALSAERAAIMTGVAGERQAALDALAAERSIIMETLQNERQAILASIEALVRETLETLERSTFNTTSTSLQTAFEQLQIVLIWVFVGVVLIVLLIWFAARNIVREARRPKA